MRMQHIGHVGPPRVYVGIGRLHSKLSLFPGHVVAVREGGELCCCSGIYNHGALKPSKVDVVLKTSHKQMCQQRHVRETYCCMSF